MSRVISLQRDAWVETSLVTLSDSRSLVLRRALTGRLAHYAAVGLEREREVIEKYKFRSMLTPVDRQLRRAFERELPDERFDLLYELPFSSSLDTSVDLQPLRSGMAHKEIVAYALQLLDLLSELHDNGLILANLSPHHLLSVGGKLLIIDFTRAITLEREYREFGSPWLILDDLRYAAPEQSGRMNRPVDYRADLYAFGATIFEWIAARPPFEHDDPLELIYSHLTRTPADLSLLRPDTPPFLTQIVMRLLAKEPLDRYQSLDGVRADLLLLQKNLQSGLDARNFRLLSSLDLPGGSANGRHFSVSHRLYGREEERAELLRALERLDEGGREVLLLSGYSGIGKTMLIRESYIPITRSKGIYVSGKFDQLQRALPYSAWQQLLQRLIELLLAEPAEELRIWGERLKKELAGRGALLIEMLPDIERLIGPQPKLFELPPSEAEIRFHDVLRSFLRAFTATGRPLVLFLDDLQWIDAASLSLFRRLSIESDLDRLFLIGAYRDNEVAADHPLQSVVVELRQFAAKESSLRLSEITLGPLPTTAIGELLSDTFAGHRPGREVERVVEQKTGGNPFFLWQFLRNLRHNDLVRYDATGDTWLWNLAEIERLDYSDNVVELMLHRFGDLSTTTRRALSAAATLGADFDIETLAELLAESPVATAALLDEALHEEFLLPQSSAELLDGRLIVRHFRFLHDRMQEAAYRSLTAAERDRLHLRAAQLLRSRAKSEEELNETIFDIVDHLDFAAELLTTSEELLDLARLNYLAAKRARRSSAFATALGYLRNGMARLDQIGDIWILDPHFAADIYTLRGELEYLNANFVEAELYVTSAISRAADIFRKASLYHMLIVQYTLRALYRKAIETAREGLMLFDVVLPESNYEAARDIELNRVDRLLGGRPLSAFGELEEMSDPKMKSIMLLLTGMGPPCYRAHPQLWAVIVAREMVLCLEHGSVPGASYSYPAFGGLLTHVGRGTTEGARALAESTLALMARYHSRSPTDSSVGYLMIGSSLRHWFSPLIESSRDYLDAYKTGLDSGNLQYAVYGFGHNCYCRFFQGVALDELEVEVLNAHQFALGRRNLWGVDLSEGVLRLIETLRVGTMTFSTESRFSRSGESEADYLSRTTEHGNLQVLCIYHILRCEVLLHLGNTAAALESLQEAGKRLESVSTQGLLPAPQYYLLRALLLCSDWSSLELSAEQADAELQQIEERFRLWSSWCAENYSYVVPWLTAERARLLGDLETSLESYDQALDLAHRCGQRHREALIAQRAAEFWEERGKGEFAAIYRRRAVDCYRIWGGVAVLIHNSTFSESVTALAQSDSGELATLNDFNTRNAIELAQLISSQHLLSEVARSTVESIAQLSAAQRVALVRLTESEELTLLVDYDPQQLADQRLPSALLLSAWRSGQRQLFEPGSDHPLFQDRCFTEHPVRSALVLPLRNLSRIVAILYLEHYEIEGLFHSELLPLLEFMGSQIATSLTNAHLYEELREEGHRREELLRQLEQRNRELTRIGEAMAHHFQEPTRRLVTYARRLKESAESIGEDERQLALKYIDQEASRLTMLVGDVQRYLSLEQKAIYSAVRCDSGKVLAYVIESIPAEERDYRIELLSDLPHLHFSIKLLERLFSILLDNSLRYRKEGVELLIRISHYCHEDRAIFRFADNGSGVEPQYREKIFHLFVRLVSSRIPGTGVGLALLRKAIRLSGGECRVEDGIDGGVAILFDLPLTAAQSNESGNHAEE